VVVGQDRCAPTAFLNPFPPPSLLANKLREGVQLLGFACGKKRETRASPKTRLYKNKTHIKKKGTILHEV
jgi:hypothetical protein